MKETLQSFNNGYQDFLTFLLKWPILKEIQAKSSSE